MLVASFFIGTGTEAPIRRLAWRSLLVLAGAAVGSAVWFTIVQKWILGAFCPYCVATHIIGLLLAALVIWRAPRHIDNGATNAALSGPSSPTSVERSVCRLPAIAPALLGVTLAGILVVCQIGFAPPAVNHVGESQRELPAIDPHKVPLVGSPEAPYVIDLLFDYKCPHCQQLHFMLNQAIRRYGGKLAFALCPTPLNRQCNPYIPRDVDEFKDSCELAKVGLAVWLANRQAFPVFDDWMFSFESGDHWHPRSLDAARAKAVELVGQANYDTACADPWISRYLQSSIRIFASTFQNRSGAIPKLVFGSRWVIPEAHDANDLVSILQTSLAVPRP
jgi:protein-disulfide isomerase